MHLLFPGKCNEGWDDDGGWADDERMNKGKNEKEFLIWKFGELGNFIFIFYNFEDVDTKEDIFVI